LFQKLTSATFNAEYVALPTEWAQYNCGRRCLLSGVLARKLLKSHGGCCFVALPGCQDLFSTVYLCALPHKYKSQVVKSGECRGQRPRPISRPSKLSLCFQNCQDVASSSVSLSYCSVAWWWPKLSAETCRDSDE